MRLAGYAARTEPVLTVLDPIEISAVLLEGATQALIGMKAYANFADGSVSFAATGSPSMAMGGPRLLP